MAVYKFLAFPLCVTSTLILRMSSKMGKIPWSNHDLFQSPNLRPLMKEMQVSPHGNIITVFTLLGSSKLHYF